jgi:hypothetical protein
VEKPLELAEYVLRETANWDRAAILAAIERQKQQSVWLPEPIPVYIQYRTAWVDRDGTVQFRNDIYGYDGLPDVSLPITVVRNPRPDIQPETPPAVLPEVPPATPRESQPVSPSEAKTTM